jgi:Xaa-Pro dipeptidase
MITRQERIRRLERLQDKLATNDLDAFLVTATDSIYYLTGVSYEPLERPFFIILRPQAAPCLLVPALEVEHLRAAPNVEQVDSYWDYPSPPGQGWPERLHDLLAGVSALGVEPSLPQEIAVELGEFSPCPLTLIEELRLIKSPAEVDMLRRAAHYADLAVGRVLDASYYGVSEIELFSQGRAVQTRMIKENQYDALASSVLVWAAPAPMNVQPHGVPSVGDRLREGPHTAMSLVRLSGYAAECERTYFLAPPTAEMKAAFGAMQEARRRAFALVRPGTSCAEIDRAANEFLRDEGYGACLLHRSGHGFGLGAHEGPWVAEGSPEILAANMLISIEPGIYLPGVGGLRHSDTVLVTEDGYESLTTFASDLDSLTIRAYKPLVRLWGGLLRRAVGV